MKKTILLFLLLIPFILTGCSCDKSKEHSFTLIILNEQEQIINEKVAFNEGENLLEILKNKYGLVYNQEQGKILQIKNIELAETGYFTITLNDVEQTSFVFEMKDQYILKIQYHKESSFKEYEVTFKEVDDTLISSYVWPNNSLVSKPAPPEKEGYTFKGYYLDKEATLEFDFNSYLTRDTVIYFIYEEIVSEVSYTIEFPTQALRKKTAGEDETIGIVTYEPSSASIKTMSVTSSDDTKLSCTLNLDQVDNVYKVKAKCLDFGTAKVIVNLNGKIQEYEFTLYPRREEDVPDNEWFEMSFEEQEAMRLDRERREAEVIDNEVERIKTWFTENIPDSTVGNFDLIERSDVSGVYVNWHSDNKNVLYLTYVDNVYVGQITQISYDTNATLSLTVSTASSSETITKEIAVPGFNLIPLPDHPLVFAYVPIWNFTGISPEDISRIDVFHLCFGYVKNDEFDVSHIEFLMPHIMPLRRMGKRVVLSVHDGGKLASATDDGVEILGFSDAVSTAEKRTRTVNQIMETVIKYDLDGVDLDWEGPGFSYSSNPCHPDDVINFYLFVKELKAAMDASPRADLLLTAACAAPKADQYSLDKLKDDFDYIHIMTYDFVISTTTTHNSALLEGPGSTYFSTEKGLNEYLRYMPREKLTVGAAFYGKIYNLPNGIGDGLSQTVSEACKTINYDKIRQEYWTDLNDETYIHKSEVTKATWYYDGSSWITFESPWAVAEKAKWAKNQNLGGIMFWDYNTDYQNELMSALYYNFRY